MYWAEALRTSAAIGIASVLQAAITLKHRCEAHTQRVRRANRKPLTTRLVAASEQPNERQQMKAI